MATTDLVAAAAPAGPEPLPKSPRRVVLAAAAAASAEWYDFLIFGIAAALVFGTAFFPSASPFAGVLAAFATFGVGFLARPLGGILAGHFGDRYGRRPVLVVALIGMGAATVGIGALPTYSTAGLFAPVALVVLRIAQGLCVGAQWAGATLLATEYAPLGRRGLYGSLVQLGVPIGLVLANVAFLVSDRVAGDDFASWGWRLPFLIGVVVIGLGIYIHRNVEDTPDFRRSGRPPAGAGRQRSPLSEILRHHKGTVLLAAGAFAVASATFYILVAGMVDYATRTLGMPRGQVLMVTLIVSCCQFAVIPLCAALSDRIGRLRVYATGAVALALWAVPMFWLIDTGGFGTLLVASLVGTVCLALMYGPQAALFTELFDVSVRYTGASLGYQLGSLVGGAVAPIIMVVLLESAGGSMAVAGYIIALSLLALASLWTLGRRVVRPEAGRPASPTHTPREVHTGV